MKLPTYHTAHKPATETEIKQAKRALVFHAKKANGTSVSDMGYEEFVAFVQNQDSEVLNVETTNGHRFFVPQQHAAALADGSEEQAFERVLASAIKAQINHDRSLTADPDVNWQEPGAVAAA